MHATHHDLMGALDPSAPSTIDALIAFHRARFGDARMEAEAPTHVEVPTGSRLPLRYEPEQVVLAVRVQELFGMTRHTAIAADRVPLTLELLSPAHRPIQITQDLPGFWAGSWRDVRAADLSYGRKRVLEIATTLALDPEVLLLDEPMAGMGQEDIGTVSELIRRVGRDRSVLMVEHNLKVVANLCQRITVLQRGEILAAGDYQTVSSDPRVRTAYMGTQE